MNDLAETGGDMVTILKCSRLAKEGAAPLPKKGKKGAASAEALEEAQEALGNMELSAERKAAVEELFAAWDFDKKGSIDRKQLNEQVGVSVGPRAEKVFTSLELMDADGDQLVTLDEMLAFFGAASSMMSDDEFSSLRDEMLEVAQTQASVASMVALAAEAPTSRTIDSTGAGGEYTGDEVTDEDAAESAPPPLSEARVALVKELFEKYADTTDVDIDLSLLQADCRPEVGPNKESVMESLALMDADGDGKVTYSEMTGYFTQVGAVLDEAEFELILGECISSAATAQLIRMVS